MNERLDRSVIMGLVFYVFICLLFSILVCGYDLDHVPKYIFGLTDTGRLWHSVITAFVFGFLYHLVTFPFVVRWLHRIERVKLEVVVNEVPLKEG